MAWGLSAFHFLAQFGLYLLNGGLGALKLFGIEFLQVVFGDFHWQIASLHTKVNENFETLCTFLKKAYIFICG